MITTTETGQAGKPVAFRPAGAMQLSGPYVGVCRALWISGWCLGVFEARDDKALVAFVRWQTELDHINWLRDHQDARKVIEALKAWIFREAGISWPRGRLDTPMGRKRAVVMRQLELLGRGGESFPDTGVDLLMKRLAPKVRASRKVAAQ